MRLFDPILLRGLEIRNRVWVPALCQYSVVEEDGVPTDWHLVHLGSFARGGAGLVIAEASAVAPAGRISPRDAGIWSDEQARAWSRVVGFVHSQGAAAGIQLAHAGRKSSTFPAWGTEGRGSLPLDDGGWDTVAPSALAFGDYRQPRALEAAELPQIVEAFRAAARRAVDAGFDLVEVHAAHGYLLHQFLSPLSNARTDAYGGPLENRARLLLEIVRAVRAELGETVPVLVRLSGTDWTEGGLEPADIATVSRWAAEAGADLMDVSSGGNVAGAHIPVGLGYQVPLAEAVRHDGGVRVAAVGLIVSPQQAAAIVEDGQADAVLLGRATMRDPHWTLRAAHELGAEVRWPPQYLRAQPTLGW